MLLLLSWRHAYLTVMKIACVTHPANGTCYGFDLDNCRPVFVTIGWRTTPVRQKLCNTHLHDFLFHEIASSHFLYTFCIFYPYVKLHSKLLLSLFLVMWSVLLMVKISFLTRCGRDLIKSWLQRQRGSCRSIFTGF